MSKVSIVLPTYNGSRYLREAIANCLNQTYSNIELIVVDDASTDDTPAILASYQDPRLQVIRHERNKRLPTALNTGFAHATGKYLTWTSDDNFYTPQAIETLVQYLEDHPLVAFVYSRCWLVDETGAVVGEVETGPPEGLEYNNCVGACFLYRREVYEAIGDYNAKVALSEDYEYWLRVMQRFRMAFLDEPLYYYRQHSQSLTASDYGNYRAQRQTLRIRRTYFRLPWKPYTKQMSHWFITEAFDSYRRGDMSNVRRTVNRGLLYDCTWLRNRGVLSLWLQSFVGDRATSRLRKLVESLCREHTKV